MRYFIELAYNGTNYHGWQTQPGGIVTVQTTIVTALSNYLHEEISVVGCGRTDTGVHARQFFLHFDTKQELDDNFIYKLNRYLPEDIAFFRVIPVDERAHTRFDATDRTYQYFVHQQKTPFLKDKSYYHIPEIDFDKMNEVATMLLGYTDFFPLSKSGSDNKTTLCDLKVARWEWNEEKTGLVFTVTANRFLRNMVRMLTAVSLMVGKGKLTIEQVKEQMDKVERFKYLEAVPPGGLYLTKVEYPYL